jgi:hypothetical protein
MPYQCDANVTVPSDCGHTPAVSDAAGPGTISPPPSEHLISSTQRASTTLCSNQQEDHYQIENRPGSHTKAAHSGPSSPKWARRSLDPSARMRPSRFSVGKLLPAEQTQPPRPAVSDLSQLSGGGGALFLVPPFGSLACLCCACGVRPHGLLQASPDAAANSA